MGIILSLIKALAPFALLGAIGAYYALNPRRPPPRQVRGPGGREPRSELVSGATKEKIGKAKRAVRGGDSELSAAPSSAKLAPPPPPVLPGSLFDASASDTPTRPSPSREPSKSKLKRPLVSSVASLATDTTSDTGADLSGKESAGPKKKRKPKKAAAPAAPLAPPPVPLAPAATANELDNTPWTRVTKKSSTKPGTAAKNGGGGSPSISSSGLTTEEDLESSRIAAPAASTAAAAPAKDDRQTLAERLVPRAPATRVDDMLETPHDAALARVMRIAPAPGDVPATGSWGDYEDVSAGDTAGSDDGFTPVVKARAKQRIPREPSDTTSSSAQPISSYSSDGGKKQRQNAARRDAVKGAKAEAEEQRLARLAKHRKEQIADIYSTGGRRTLSGGQKASVDDNSHLTWGS